jgi:hypothetical protein
MQCLINLNNHNYCNRCSQRYRIHRGEREVDTPSIFSAPTSHPMDKNRPHSDFKHLNDIQVAQFGVPEIEIGWGLACHQAS